MKNLILVVFLMLNYTSAKAQIDASYQIGTWKGFSKTAVSYTWDDNSSKQLTVGMPLFDAYNFKSTYFIITNNVNNWPAFQAAADNGHEVASHTKSHPNFGSLSVAERAEELLGSKNAINTKITNSNCVTIAYPFCAVGTDAQTAATYISARTCQQNIERSTPSNFMQISAITCGTEGQIKTSQDFDNKVKNGLSSNGWVVFLLHGIDGDNGWSPIESAALASHLSFMDASRADFWVATYGQVVKYIKERDAASLIELSTIDNTITLELSNDLGNDTIYNEPLSIQRMLPTNWLSAEVTQNGAVLESQIIEEGENLYLRFDALPNTGNITLTGSNMIVSTKTINASIATFNVFPNPSDGVTYLAFDLKTAGGVSISIVDVSGRLIKTFEEQTYSSGQHKIAIDANEWKEQLVYCVISLNGKAVSKKALIKY